MTFARMRLLSCFLCSSIENNQELGSSSLGITSLDTQLQRGASQTLSHLQASLLSLEGSWFRRAEGLLRILWEHGIVARIYGFLRRRDIADEDSIFLLSSSKEPDQQPYSDEQRVALVRRLSAIQHSEALSGQEPPVHVARPLGIVASASAVAALAAKDAVAAIPLIQAGQLVGGLWLAKGTSDYTAPGHPGEALRQPPSDDAIAVAAAMEPGALASALLCSDDALRRLSFAASMLLAGSGSDSLRWLTEAVVRLRAAASMQALIAALCVSLAAHVHSRFMLEPAISAALVPSPAGPAGISSGQMAASISATTPSKMALLFRSAGSAPIGAARAVEQQLQPQSAALELEPTQLNAAGGSMSHTRDAPVASPPQIGGAFNRPSRPADDGTGSSYGPGRTYGHVWAPSQAFASTRDSVARSARSFTTGQAEALSFSGTATAAFMGRPAGRSGGIAAVVALSPEDVAAVASSASRAASTMLFAEAFPFRGSLLQAVLVTQQQQQQEQLTQPNQPRMLRAAPSLSPLAASPPGFPAPPLSASPPQPSKVEELLTPSAVRCNQPQEVPNAAAAATAASHCWPAGTTVVEDIHLHLQNAGLPLRDLCLLMDQRGGGTSATSNRGVEGDTTLGGATRHAAPECLVVLTVRLQGGAALGLYLCFPKRLPGPLLRAMQASCQELLDKVLADPVRTQLEGPLAIEYDTLRNAPPGSYAILRSTSVLDDAPATVAGAFAFNTPPLADGGDDSELSARQGPLLAPSAIRQFDTAYSPEAAARSMSFTVRHATETACEPAPFVGDLRRRLSAVIRANSFACGRSRFPSVTATGLHATSPSKAPSGVYNPTAGRSGSVGVAGAAGGVSSGARTSTDAGGTFRIRHALDELRTGSLRDLSQTCGDGSSGLAELHLDTPTNGALIITVADPEPSTDRACRQLELLVSSIQSTFQASIAVGATSCSFAGDLDQLKLVEVLGRGGGGVVLKGIMSGSLPVAVKLVHLADDDAEQPDETGIYVRRVMLRNAMELAVQSALSHPNIVQLYGTFSNVVLRSREAVCAVDSAGEIDPTTLSLQILQPDEERGPGDDSSNVICILAEFCDRGSLLEALRSGSFPERVFGSSLANSPLARAFSVPSSGGSAPFPYDMRGLYMTLLDVALALRHLHSLNLVHRDVKPANVLLKSSMQDCRGFIAKLADFGFVLQLNETAEDGTRCATVERPCGTLTHMAPECLQNKAKVGTAADIYSFGILMWELFAGGVRPFSNVAVVRIPRVVCSGARPSFIDSVPQAYRGLAHQCWRTDPRRRPRAADLVTVLGSLLSNLR